MMRHNRISKLLLLLIIPSLLGLIFTCIFRGYKGGETMRVKVRSV